MSTTRIDYKMLAHGTNDFLEAVDFAESFDHKIVEHPQIQVCGHYKNGQLIGYSDHVFIPTIYPAFHPDHCTARDVVRCMEDLKTYIQLTRGAGYIGVPLEQGRPKFSDEIMKKLGLSSINREIFCITETKEN